MSMTVSQNNDSYSIHYRNISPDVLSLFVSLIRAKFAYDKVSGCSVLDTPLVEECRKHSLPQLSTHHLIVSINYDELLFEAARLSVLNYNNTDIDKVQGVALYSNKDCARWVTPIYQLNYPWRN